MDFLTKQASGLSVWAFALVAVAAVLIGTAVYNIVATQNIITIADGSSVIKPSYFGAMTNEKRVAVGAKISENLAKRA